MAAFNEVIHYEGMCQLNPQHLALLRYFGYFCNALFLKGNLSFDTDFRFLEIHRYLKPKYILCFLCSLY